VGGTQGPVHARPETVRSLDNIQRL
jgi:hypothetical protein